MIIIIIDANGDLEGNYGLVNNKYYQARDLINLNDETRKEVIVVSPINGKTVILKKQEYKIYEK